MHRTLSKLSSFNRHFYRLFCEITAKVLIEKDLDVAWQIVASSALKELALLGVERMELLSFIYLYLKRMPEVTYYCPESMATLIESLKIIVLTEKLDPRSVWKVFLEQIFASKDKLPVVIQCSLCDFMGSFFLVNNGKFSLPRVKVDI
jgi:hypothetical protein